MPFIPHPVYFVVIRWALDRGLPIVARRLSGTRGLELPDEDVVYQGLATLERNRPIPGVLSLTPSRLVFLPTQRDDRAHSVSVPRSDIVQARPVNRWLLRLVPLRTRSIGLQTTRGNFVFQVDDADRERWLRDLQPLGAAPD